MPAAIPGPGRFAGGRWIRIEDAKGVVRFVPEIGDVPDRSALGDDDWTIHVTTMGEALDAIAFRTVGDVRLWWLIADMNRDIVDDPLRIPPGLRLVAPLVATVVRRAG